MQSDLTIALPPAIKNPASLERRDNALGDDPEHVGPLPGPGAAPQKGARRRCTPPGNPPGPPAAAALA